MFFNMDSKVILAKTLIIGRTYAASLERRRRKEVETQPPAKETVKMIFIV